jgi:hypothetical protein
VSGQKISFNVTPKSKQKSVPLRHCWPHILIVTLTLLGLALNLDPDLYTDPQFALAMLINGLWSIQNAWILGVYIRAAFWNTELYGVKEKENEELTSKTISSQWYDKFTLKLQNLRFW